MAEKETGSVKPEKEEKLGFLEKTALKTLMPLVTSKLDQLEPKVFEMLSGVPLLAENEKPIFMISANKAGDVFVRTCAMVDDTITRIIITKKATEFLQEIVQSALKQI